MSFAHWFSRSATYEEVTGWVLLCWTGRAIGLDVDRDFCEVAICEDGGWSAPRVG